MTFYNVLPADKARLQSTYNRKELFQKAISEGIKSGRCNTFVRFKATEEEALALADLGYEVSVTDMGVTHIHWF